MSSIQVNVLYNGIETLMEIEINEDNLFNSFLDIFRQKFSIAGPKLVNFKLIAINTNVPYLLIDEDNIANIIKEKIPNGAPLKILLTNEDDELEEIKRDSINNYICGFVKGAKMDADEDDFVDDFAVLDEKANLDNNKNENEENEIKDKEEEEKINKMLSDSLNNEANQNKNNQFTKENDDEKNKNENIIENENDLDVLNLNENLRLSDSGNININSVIIDKDNDKDKEKNNKDDNKTNSKENGHKEKKNLFKDKNTELPIIPLDIPKNLFKSEICSLCGNGMSSFKYICSICENCNLCERCEEIHIHPCFKYKTLFLSNITDTYKYIDKNYNYKIPIDSKKITKLIRKEYNLKIVPMTDLQFSLRPNKIIDIPIKVLNLSDEEINSSQFIVIVKNNKLINISYQVDKIFVIKPNEEYELKLLCRTSTTKCKEKIHVEIYSAELSIRMSSRLNFDLEIEINDDEDDEKLNQELNNDKYAIFHTKLHKKIILSFLYFNENWKKDMKKVCEALRANKWDTNKSISCIKASK